jgi:hypothetical protein
LFRPFEGETNRDIIEKNASVEEINFGMEGAKYRELFDL